MRGHSSQPTAMGCPRAGLCLWGLWSLRHRFKAGEHGRPSCPRGGMQMVGWEGRQEAEESGWGDGWWRWSASFPSSDAGWAPEGRRVGWRVA